MMTFQPRTDHVPGTYAPPGETLTGQSPLAYNIAGWIVLLTAVLQLVDGLLTQQYLMVVIIRAFVDFAIAFMLIRLWPGARAFTFFRALFALLFIPICTYQIIGLDPAIFISTVLPSVGYALSLLVIITGHTSRPRVTISIALYVLLSLIPFGYSFSLMVLQMFGIG